MRGTENETLAEIARLLAAQGGRYEFTYAGRDFVVLAAEDLTDAVQPGYQSTLPMRVSGTARLAQNERGRDEGDEAVLERINRDIALYRQQVAEEPAPGVGVLDEGELLAAAPLRVHFEPLRGDLPPELQE